MTNALPTMSPQLIVGRYAIYHEIAAGGMATVHLGRLLGPVGFSRTVAIKRLHSRFAKDPNFVSMFVDEALVTARVRHPNVVPTLDVVSTADELFLVMEYVPGENLARCLSGYYKPRGERMPLPIALGVMAGALHGLHAAHLAKNERGEPLDIVHRDVSPQNILIGTDGLPRLLDFGVAKAVGRMDDPPASGAIKGKPCYMAPEQLEGREVDRLADVFSAGTVLWELLTGERLFQATSEVEIFYKLLRKPIPPPSERVPGLPAALDEITLRALARDPAERFPSALAMADALESLGPVATAREIGSWVGYVARDALEERQALLEEFESLPSGTLPAHLGLDDAGERAGPPSSRRPGRSSLPTLTTPIATERRRSRKAPAGESTRPSASSLHPPEPLGGPRRLFFVGLIGAATAATVASSWLLARQAPRAPAAPPPRPEAPLAAEPAPVGAPAADAPAAPAPLAASAAAGATASVAPKPVD
ncbi:MAG TPA: serine/threonine-protein kinase [Polyangiaceae bacterium]|nr:serine/threonine-protein kinase [Polyangiaceae bacterium]